LLKAAQLQLFDKTYSFKERNVTLQRIWEQPARGLIYDRNGSLLVTNEPVYELKVIYNELKPHMDTLLLCDLLDITLEDFRTRMNIDWSDYRHSRNKPFVFMSRIKPDVFARFSEYLFEFPGFYPEIRNIRNYLYPNAAHVIGYMGEVNMEILRESSGRYHLGDFMGITGIESFYEEKLKGQKGIQSLMKDNLGRIVQSYKSGELDTTAISGSDIHTTIDIYLQAYGELLMKNKRGAIIAIEPSSGEILAMISSPSYNLQDLSVGTDRGQAFRKLLQDSIGKPLLNRAVNSKYPPGSVFKPVVGLIAMQMGVSQPDRHIVCPGYYEYRTRNNVFRYRCRGHPAPRNMSIALQYSCNTYFFQLFRDVVEKHGFARPEIGLDSLADYLRQFGLGHRLDIDLGNESSGFVPESSFYNRLYSKQKAKWRSTYIMSLGIGQGELELTTLQLANIATIIANKGYYYTPHFARAFNKDQPISEEFRKRHNVKIDQRHYVSIADGMELAVASGTAPWAFIPGLPVCGKTGTSENFSIIDGRRVQMQDNSVFIGFAPKHDPKIAIAVYVENAGSGGNVAAPIGSLIIEKYINGEISLYREWLQNRIINLDMMEPRIRAPRIPRPNTTDSLEIITETLEL
jgi:penicillin-binding protein 2